MNKAYILFLSQKTRLANKTTKPMSNKRTHNTGEIQNNKELDNNLSEKYVINNNIFNEKKDAMPKAYNMGL
ncbi:MAG: hypothetical protein CL613_08010 [Aquimarina sp.]|nr:hypothetical protein [Aquimarina sp.]